MRQRLSLIVIGIGMVLGLAACGANSGTPTAAVARPGATLPGDAANGKTKYAASCATCHGPNAKGITMLGKSLVGTPFIKSISDADLAALITRGRPTSDPANTTRIEMPPRGGDSSLTNQDIADIVIYLRSLNP